MENYVILRNPIWLLQDQEEDERTVIEVYGFTIGSDWRQLDEYIDYLCGASQWEQAGNYVGISTWTAGNGAAYDAKGPFVRDYCTGASRRMGLGYDIYQSGLSLDNGYDSWYGFILKRSIWDGIRNFGVRISGCPNE